MPAMENEEIESILNCPICMEEYNDPRILPCQHTFCEACLSTYIKDLSKNKPLNVRSFPCPICRHKTKLRNNADDASSFEKDLTKIALLQSKHILLMQDDKSSDESDVFVTQTMTTQTEDGNKDSNSTSLPTESVNGNIRKPPLKRYRKRTVKKIKKSKERIAMKQNQQLKKKNKESEIKSDVQQTHDLDYMDYFLVNFILIPIISWSSTGITLHFILAIFALLLIIIFTVTVLAHVPYLCVLTTVIWLILCYRESINILSSHCKIVEIRKYQKFLVCFLRFAMGICIVGSCLYIFAFLGSSLTTVSKALLTNDSVVSFYEFRKHFFAIQSRLENMFQHTNVHAYILLKRCTGFIRFLIW